MPTPVEARRAASESLTHGARTAHSPQRVQRVRRAILDNSSTDGVTLFGLRCRAGALRAAPCERLPTKIKDALAAQGQTNPEQHVRRALQRADALVVDGSW